MAKKIWYSSPLSFYWNEVYANQKKITSHLSDEEIYQLLIYKNLKAPLMHHETAESRESFRIGLEMWAADLNQDLLHIFFLDKRLRDFLEETSLSDLGGIKDFLYENGIGRRVYYTKINDQKKCVVYSFGLHIPYETHGYAFLLSIFEDKTLELFFSHGNINGGITDAMFADLLNKSDKKSQTLLKMFKLAINTLAYMKCFPECVSDGVPRITVERNEDRTDRNIIFQVSDKISEEKKSGNSKLPHFRKGFFRHLKSDYFTHKKGDIVFVSETMVKGRAKTVSTSDKINR